MRRLDWIAKTTVVVALIFFSSFNQAYTATTASAEKNTTMGEETDLILQTRKVDPIKTGKRTIRVLVNYNATNYFIVEGKQAGLEYELMHSFENYLNKGRTADKKVHMIFIAMPFEQLIFFLLLQE